MPCWRFQALYKIREPFTITVLFIPINNIDIFNVAKISKLLLGPQQNVSLECEIIRSG